MSERLTCITCPLGCELTVERDTGGAQGASPDGASPNGARNGAAAGSPDDVGLSVTGNRCARGVKYAREELLAPKRVVSATAALAGGPEAGAERLGRLGSVSRIPVRTSAAFPKGDVPAILEAVYALKVKLPVKRGEVLIRDFRGTGIDVIATRTISG